MTKDEVIDLIRDAGFGFLATVDGSQPKVRPMMPYLTEDGMLLLALLGHSRTVAQVKKNPLVEICFVDRKMAFCRIAGTAKISENPENKETVWNNIPMLRQYFSSPQDSNFVLLEIGINSAEAMTPQQKTPDIVNLK
ncbi:MAG: pyridoxamine 5'-phosphate oxidase family protein [Candidatus Omnitrophota bacterium]